MRAALLDTMAVAAVVAALACGWSRGSAPAAETRAQRTPAAPAAPAPAVATPGTARDLAALRVSAHGVLVARCVPCHLGSDAGAKPPALEVFDLDQPDWWRRPPGPRLRKMIGRLASAPAEQRELVSAFIDAELADRGE